MNTFKHKFYIGLKFSLYLTLWSVCFLVVFSGVSVLISEFLYKPSDDYFTSKKIGYTITNKNSLKTREDADYFVIENLQRIKKYSESLDLINSCDSQNKNCFNHRLNLSDFKYFHHNPYYFLDDWWLENCRNYYIKGWDLPLKQELSRLPSGTVLVFNEYKFNSIERLIPFVKELQILNPHLRIIVGVQIHLQWFDPFIFIHKLKILRDLDLSGLPWMISEFSTYDRLYKPWKVYEFDRYIPIQIRRSFQQHQSYWIARQCSRSSNCYGFTLWSPNGVWFHSNLQKRGFVYDGQFLVFDQGQPTSLYWAIRRGLSN